MPRRINARTSAVVSAARRNISKASILRRGTTRPPRPPKGGR
jgi:hypothetical protein